MTSHAGKLSIRLGDQRSRRGGTMRKTALGMFVLLVALNGCSIVVLAHNSTRAVIDAYPNTAMVEQGTTLVLVCRVVGVPSTTVLSYQWTCPGGSCDAGAVDPEWAAKVQQGDILVVNVRNGNDAGDYKCTVMDSSTQLASQTHSVTVTNGLSFLNEDGGLKVFFPRNSFVTNTTLTHTNTPRQSIHSPDIGNDHIACYGGDPNAAQVTWHNSSGGALVQCRSGTTPVPCLGCGGTCERNGAVGVDPSLNGHTSIHLFTTDPNYVNQDLQCRVNGGQSALIGVYVMNGASALSAPSMVMTSGATTTTTVSVSWSQVSGATGYYVSYQRQDLGTPPVVTPQYERIVGGATSVTLSGLEPGTTYRIRVWSTNGRSVSSEAGEMNVTTVESAPSPPRMLTMIGTPTGSTVELNWLPPLHPNGAVRYEIEYEPAMPPGDPVNAGNSSSLYFTLILPNEFVTYNVTIAAVNILSMNSAQSVLPVCPGRNREGTVPPSGVSVVPNGCDSAEVTWRAPNSRVCDGVVSGYNVRYRLSSSTGDYTTVSTSDARVTLQNLTPNEEYTVEVAILTSVGGIGSYSPVEWFNITDPGAPSGVSATVTGCDSAEVSWMTSMSMFGETIMNYSVTYQRTSGGVLATVNSPSTRATLQGLVPNAEYSVSVAGINSCGGTSPYISTIFTLQDPAPPTGVSFVTGTICSNVSWSPSAVNYTTAIGNYSVTYRMRGGNGDNTVYTSSTSITLQDLDPSAEYEVRVAAIDLCGRMSDPSMVAQLDLQAPGPPTGVMVEDGTECYTSVVSWTVPQSRCGVVIGNYSVRYRLKNGGGNYTTMYTDGTSVTLENITPNAAYDVSVAAISSQIGQFTEALQFVLQEPKPPTDVTFRVTGTDSVMVSWTASQSKCGGITNNSVTYQLTSGTGPTTTVYTAETYTTETSIALQGLIPNREYRAMVSATNSMGVMSAISDATPPFTVSTPSTPTGDGCACAGAGAVTGAATGGVIVGVLLTVAIAGIIALVVLCRAKRRGTTKLDTKDVLYEDPNLLDQLQANPAYGMVPTSTVKVEKGDGEYATCNM